MRNQHNKVGISRLKGIKAMKVYMFRIPHFCHSETIYVLAESKQQAIKIVIKKQRIITIL